MPMIFSGVPGPPSLAVSVAEGMPHCKASLAEKVSDSRPTKVGFE
jgi:hypothetical protein